ncbi:tRNA pseudouridine(55) synthase TruB [Fibrobacterota bacterium]
MLSISVRPSSPASMGFLLINKPAGISSFRALQPVKKLYRGLKTGFAGTLDPGATGLMIVGVGNATRLLKYFEEMNKVYRFNIIPGITTDSYDTDGSVIKHGDASRITRHDVEKILERFTGEISQVPPVYSALKVKGKRACDRARAGEAVSLAPRNVIIQSLKLEEWSEKVWTMEVTCSKGTYVRSLANDIGERLGCGAVASGIRRTAIGRHRVSEAVEINSEEGLKKLLPVDTAVEHLTVATVHERFLGRLLNGNVLTEESYRLEPGGNRAEDETCRIHDHSGRLLALGLIGPDGSIQPKMVFAASD